jgi:hypothetical protein
MITLTEQPDNIATVSTTPKAPPVPVSECWRWCMQADDADAITTAGAKATLTVSFPPTCTIPANGTAFKLWGYDFTINDGSDFTANSFKVVSSGLFTAFYFGQMINANFFFNRAVKITFSGTTTVNVIITWNECREQPRFTVADMVFTGITATGATAAAVNGTSPEYVEGFSIISRLGRYVDATSEFLPIGLFSGSAPDYLCDTTSAICVDMSRDAQTQLFTRIPDLANDSFITQTELGRSFMRLFALEYGWIYRESCQSQSGTIKKSGIVLGINAAFDVDDPYKMRRYWYDHPDGLPDGASFLEYLTTQPKTHKLGVNSFAWLWMTNNWGVDYSGYKLVAIFTVVHTNGTSESFDVNISDSLSGGNFYRAVNFNVSPGYVYDNTPTFTPTVIAYYSVRVEGWDSITDELMFADMETLTFIPISECDGFTDVYFLTSPGGIGTMPVVVLKKEEVQEGSTITLSTTCDASRLDMARYGGRINTALKSYTRYTCQIQADRTEQFTRWVKDFRNAPQHWIKVYETPVNNTTQSDPIAKRLYVDFATLQTYSNESGVFSEFTAYTDDVPRQTANYPAL